MNAWSQDRAAYARAMRASLAYVHAVLAPVMGAVEFARTFDVRTMLVTEWANVAPTLKGIWS